MWPNQISWPLVSEVGILGSSMHCNTSVYRITSCHVTWSNLRRQVKRKQYSFLARLWWTVHYRRNTEGSLVRQPYKPLVCYRGWDHLGPRHCSLPKAELAAAIHDSMYARVLKMEHSLTHLRLQMQYCTDGKLFVLRGLNAMTKVQMIQPTIFCSQMTVLSTKRHVTLNVAWTRWLQPVMILVSPSARIIHRWRTNLFHEKTASASFTVDGQTLPVVDKTGPSSVTSAVLCLEMLMFTI